MLKYINSKHPCAHLLRDEISKDDSATADKSSTNKIPSPVTEIDRRIHVDSCEA